MEELPDGSSFIVKFDLYDYEFLNWRSHFEFIVEFAQIKDDKKVEFLLNLMAPSSFATIERHTKSSNPFDFTYEALMALMEKLFADYEKEWAMNFRFWSRNQMYGETIPNYVLALRKIISKCSQTINSSENLVCRFINGIASEEAKQVLQNSKNLTFAKAIAIAQRMELDKISSFKRPFF